MTTAASGPNGERSSPGASASGTFHFSVDASLLFQLGEELVRKRSVALAELIKNAYDADSTRVIVTFRDARAPGGTIVVSDNGTGMAFDDIDTAWMRIATSQKSAEQVSRRFHRLRTGAKGIGRFAARRLAKHLILTTVARNNGRRDETIVEFDWDAFKPGAEVQTVGVTYRRRQLPLAANKDGTGTELRLIGTRDAWDEADMHGLAQDLARLVAPSRRYRPMRAGRNEPAGASHADPGIQIRIEAPEFPSVSGDIRDQPPAGAVAVLEGTLQRDGTADYSVSFRQPKKVRRFRSKTALPHVGPARFRIHFFVYKKDYFAGLDLNVRDAARRGREEGGVHLYVDRFRVAPYGDPGDDWLKLDEDRGRRLVRAPAELARFARHVERPMLFLPGNNQLFGHVYVSRRTNPDIRQTLNREGVIETLAFQELRQFVRTGINYLTVAYARESEAKRRAAKARGQREDAAALLLRARREFAVASESMLPEQRAQILQAIDLARQTVETQREELITELSMLRVLASTGTMLVVFEHQILGTLNGLRASHRSLQARLQQLSPAMREQFSTELSRLDTWIKSAQHQAELLGLLIARKSRTRRRRLPVRPVVDVMKRAFGSYTDDYGINVDNQVLPALKTPPMFDAELSSILVNLLTNAFKAVRDQPDRRVLVTGVSRPDATVIRVCDTGLGAARERWEEFFEPFVGESEPDPILGEGTGLGLKIVRDFVGVYGGTARFVEPDGPWHTCVEISLPEE